jgi:hypothetical protein
MSIPVPKMIVQAVAAVVIGVVGFLGVRAAAPRPTAPAGAGPGAGPAFGPPPGFGFGANSQPPPRRH